ncbi:DUF302 domain-containing protein [Christiangramia echinicola]|uniref:Uncharacterized conserved protein, DUF302 family n=1 Tax=Christiangramia echinicola TaxID=279359 RepID=A0A1H1KXL2_9FLAO|nr:DUF302 domain-containing protein [Christiangramia echinicola]SDR66429.1 Uncharacterized conserved protein, DUF302 family [Christiangramia echinicola]
MEYYFKRTLEATFDEVETRVKKELEKEGFGVLTEIKLEEAFKKKLDKDFRRYHILGACNAPYAFEALKAEDKIGTMLPCNVIIQEWEENKIEVAAVNPVASMQAVENDDLNGTAREIAKKLLRVVEMI